MSEAATAALDKIIDAVANPGLPGYVVGVAHKGKTIYRRATGVASIEQPMPNTTATRVRIASVTKMFTGLAVMLLVEDGKLELDRPVRHYLPDLTRANGEPTLRQLLNHTGGVRDALETAAFFLSEGLFPYIPAGLTHQWSSRIARGNFAPGSGWSYSNYGYMLLSLVIEKASGISLAQFFRERVFAPLGMADSVLHPDDMELLPGLAASHIKKPDGSYHRGIYPCAELVGGGGIVSTVDDMLRYAANLREHTLGSEASWAEILGPARLNNGVEYSYGFSIKRQLHRGLDLLWHTGSTFGSTSALLSFPDQALDVIVLSNRSDSDCRGIAARLAEALIGDQFGPAQAFAADKGREALAGNYYSPDSRRMFGIKPHADKLLFSIDSIPEGFLIEEGDKLVSDSTIGTLRVSHVPASPVSAIELEILGQRETLQRLPDQAPDAAQLAPGLLGRYLLEDFGTPVEIVLDQGALHIDLNSRYHPCRLRLTPVSADLFIFSGKMGDIPIQGTISLERRGDEVTGFHFSTQRIRNLHFARQLA